MLTWARHEEFGDDGGILCEGDIMQPCLVDDSLFTGGLDHNQWLPLPFHLICSQTSIQQR